MKHRILLAINNLDTAGMKYVLAAIAKRIDKSRFSPVVLVSRKSGTTLEKELSALVPVEEMGIRSKGLVSTVFNSGRTIKKLRSMGSVMHDCDYSSDWTAAWLSRRTGIPYIAEKTNLSFGSWRWRLKLGLSSHIVCLSSAQQQLLEAYQSKLSVIPIGVDISKFASARPISREALDLNEGDTVLISVAHLVPVKGHEELIEAVARIADKYPRLRILLVGRGDQDYVQHLEDLAVAKNVRNRFRFAGPTDNVQGMLQMADGKILATQNRGRKEAFGAAIVEAMVAGLPVIATRSGGPEDIVVEGVTGFLVAGNGPDALVDGIEQFMQSRKRWKEMGNAGYNRAIQLYREEDMVRAYESVYTKVLQSK